MIDPLRVLVYFTLISIVVLFWLFTIAVGISIMKDLLNG